MHQLPHLDEGNIRVAQTEVRLAGGPPQRHFVTEDEVVETLRAATRRIHAPAVQVCREMNVGVCEWTFRRVQDSSMNAGALPNGLIVVNRGIVEYADNDEEVCLVVAHEIGHQAADHVAASRRNQMIGALIGAALVGAVGALASQGSYDAAATTRSAIQAGANIGQRVGHLAYSKEQEREADYLAALILYRAGVDLDRARSFLVKMARMDGDAKTGLLDTHPAGPERIAGWDEAVAEIRASGGRLPRRAS